MGDRYQNIIDQENIKLKQKLAQLYEKRQKQNRSLLIVLLALLLILANVYLY